MGPNMTERDLQVSPEGAPKCLATSYYLILVYEQGCFH